MTSCAIHSYTGCTMSNWQHPITRLRVRAAHIFRRIPWLISFLQRLYRILQPKFTAGAVGLLFNDQGQILLVEHIFHPRHPWGPPGGWVDANETPIRAVAREMNEEVGLHVQVGELIHIEFLPAMRHMTFAYLCDAASHNVNHLSPELIGFAWHDPDSLPNVYPFIREAVQIALARRALSPSRSQE